MMDTNSIISLSDIDFCYPDGYKALRTISLDLPKAKKICFLGPNGAGKSTLFLLFNGIHKPQKGTYFFDGQQINWDKKQLFDLRRRVGLVFQEPDNQLFAPTVYEELSFGLLNLQLQKNEIRQRIDAVMQQFAITDLQNKAPHLLSYGQKRRVALASIVAMHPEVLILDEAFSGLDGENSQSLHSILNDLNNSGMTVIVSSHDVNFAYEWADVIVALKSADQVYTDSTAAFFQNNKILEQFCITKPYIVSVYEQLIMKKLPHAALPKSNGELLQMLHSL